MLKWLLASFVCFAALAPAAASEKQASDAEPFSTAQLPPIEEKTAEMDKLAGLFPLYWEEAAGTLWLEIPSLDTELLYVHGLSAGLGSNDIGLDRGELGRTHLVEFRRVGRKILMVEPTTRFRTSSSDPHERRAVEESFATSVIWGFVVEAESDDRVLVDLTDFLMRDAHGVAGRLRPARFRLDPSRSAVHMPRTRAFPKNTEMEVTLTFTAEGSTADAGGGVERGALRFVTPSAEAVTVRQHHSLIELPDPGYQPRRLDPRAGFGAVSFEDYAAPLGEPTTQRYIRRHRLAKRDPDARLSDPVEPIIYYVDRGAPEPVRSAILEGARWWNQAFEAAGYRDAFRVELMPEGADSMDVRYNVIQWVYRSTRGWSYGGGITDPRTGEILEGHVTLGALRVRQDYLLAEGLLSPYPEGDETPAEPTEMALARIRQLSAHEVGHAIGLGHNYYDSRLGRISVMDYPQPLTRLRSDGTIDLSDAYAVGVGEWDKVAVTWGYQDFPPGTEQAKALEVILEAALERDLASLGGQDISLNPRADQWANGRDPAAELLRMMKVRRVALERFGERATRIGRPVALIEEALVPLFLHHRYQVEAAASTLGGLSYLYAIRGDGREPFRSVPAAEQRAALDALTKTLAASELVVPESIRRSLPPRPSGYSRHRELFPTATGLAFDPLAPAAVAAELTVSAILEPRRAARMVAQHAVDPSLPGLGEVVDRLLESGFDAPTQDSYEAAVRRSVGNVLTEQLIALAAQAPSPQVRAIAAHKLAGLRDRLLTQVGGEESDVAHRFWLAADIARFLDRPAATATIPQALSVPPGAPIGGSSRQEL
jgi:hypothetical protein